MGYLGVLDFNFCNSVATYLLEESDLPIFIEYDMTPVNYSKEEYQEKRRILMLS